MRILTFLFAVLLSGGTLFAQQAEKPDAVFDQIYGKDIAEAQKTPAKKVELGLRILDDSSAIKRIELRKYAIQQAVELLLSDKDGYPKAIAGLQELRNLSPAEKREYSRRILETQVKLVKSMAGGKDKDKYEEEAQNLADFGDDVATLAIEEDDYKEALDALAEEEKNLKSILKDFTKEVADKMKLARDLEARFKKFEKVLLDLEKTPDDAKNNLRAAEYYLFEKGNLFRAWPYFEKSGEKDFLDFFGRYEKALLEIGGYKEAPDGLSLSRLPMAIENPAAFLSWLKEKEIADKANLLMEQQNRLTGKKPLDVEGIKQAIENQTQAAQAPNIPTVLYLDLADSFDMLLDYVSKIKDLDEETLNRRKGDFTVNRYVALAKAKLKASKDKKADDAIKEKIDLGLKQIEGKLKPFGEKAFQVDIPTTFRFSPPASNLKPKMSGAVLYLSFDKNTLFKRNQDWVFKDLSGRNNDAVVRGKFAGAKPYDTINEIPKEFNVALVKSPSGSPDDCALYIADGGGLNLGSPPSFPEGKDKRSMCALGLTTTLSDNHAMMLSFGTAQNGSAMFLGRSQHILLGGGYGDDLARWGFWENNVWHHLALTYDGTKAKLYTDGQMVAQQDKNWNLKKRIAFVGKQVAGDDGADFWNGLLDEVAIFRRVLSERDAQEIFRSNKARMGR